MRSAKNRTQPLRQAKLASVAYAPPDNHNLSTYQPSWTTSSILMDVPEPSSYPQLSHCHTIDRIETTVASKRKADRDASAPSLTKKQKIKPDEERISDESFRTAQTQQLGLAQPIGISMGQIPLNNVERWRLRGWRWPEAVVRSCWNMPEEAESPRGTTFLGLR
ncbi:hypothetical protein CC86DRAFT_383400 [Ophiobolus disseminans]|uniref:Uncharacterized protein n=1 Tax=Ophiobolus disseminans TaxID=1469910 RepID=A0A6A6ZXF8_9PLEO|nr:hypothetical protein CC86DRAFT_383400 [Ophiobolus disseminans]